MKTVAALALALVFAAGGYLWGARGRLRPAPPSPEAATLTVPEVHPGSTAPDRASTDCSSIKAQLAICMAYHPSIDEKDKQLRLCQSNLETYKKSRRTLDVCYDFIDFAPIYDRELGEADPSPETLERAKSMTATGCVSVLTWASRAQGQLTQCLEGETPPSFKERYAQPIGARALVKACNSEALHRDAMNAWLRREEGRVREMDHGIKNHLWMDPDGGIHVETMPPRQ